MPTKASDKSNDLSAILQSHFQGKINLARIKKNMAEKLNLSLNMLSISLPEHC
jgi:hypothetical protein